MKRCILLLFVLALSLLSCFDPPVTEPTAKIGFWFLKDSTLNDMDSLNLELNNLELADTPWLSEKNIDFYEWEGHYIYLNKSKRELLPSFFGGDSSFYGNTHPFVVTVDSVRCYLGCFQNFVSSWGDYYPSISEIEFYAYPHDMLSYFYWPVHAQDLRDNDLLKSALQENDQYQGGLEARLDTSYGAHFAISNDTLHISYRMILRNHNDKALYVLDPRKCGDDVFYYLFGYPALSGLTTSSYWAFTIPFEASMPDTSEYADLRFYSRIPAGDSLSLPMTIHGDPLESDTYVMWNYLGSFIEGMNKERRSQTDGRIWVGWTWLPFYLLEYDGGDMGTLTEIDESFVFGKPVNNLPVHTFKNGLVVR